MNIVRQILFGLFVALFCNLTQAQNTPLQNLVSQATELTKSADSVESFTKLLDVCNQSKNLSLSADYEKYFRELTAWTYNKRGELISEESIKLEDADAQLAEEKKALLDFENAVRLNSRNWKAVHNRGVSHALIGDHKKALTDFDQTIRLNSRYSNAWFNRAEIKYQLGQHTSAINDYTQAIRLNPKDAAAYNGRGHSRYMSEQYREALTDYSQAVRIAPEEMEGYANRADALSDLGYWETAIKDYRQALKLGPTAHRVKQGLAWVLATCPETQLRNPQEALRLAKEALDAADEKSYRYFDTLAAAQASAGDYDTAQENIDKAFELAPEEEKPLLENRKVLYQSSRPYREPKR